MTSDPISQHARDILADQYWEQDYTDTANEIASGKEDTSHCEALRAITKLLAERDALRSLLSEAEGVLTKVGDEARFISASIPSGYDIHRLDHETSITVGDLRAASTLLAKIRGMANG